MHVQVHVHFYVLMQSLEILTSQLHRIKHKRRIDKRCIMCTIHVVLIQHK